MILYLFFIGKFFFFEFFEFFLKTNKFFNLKNKISINTSVSESQIPAIISAENDSNIDTDDEL